MGTNNFSFSSQATTNLRNRGCTLSSKLLIKFFLRNSWSEFYFSLMNWTQVFERHSKSLISIDKTSMLWSKYGLKTQLQLSFYVQENIENFVVNLDVFSIGNQCLLSMNRTLDSDNKVLDILANWNISSCRNFDVRVPPSSIWVLLLGFCSWWWWSLSTKKVFLL